MEPKVFIVILNWNGWNDTITCLKSVWQLAYVNFQVILCDNGSNDGSLSHIKKWAVCNRIDSSEYSRRDVGEHEKDDHKLILIDNEQNLGFAAGNNVGLRFALNNDDFDYVWLLNNDTAVEAKALSHLVRSALEDDKRICGSQLLYYSEPHQIQALGNSFNVWLGTSRFVVDKDRIKDIDFLVGASMLISRKALKEIGLLSEEYFLYYEEADYWQRCKGKYVFHSVLDSVVYHKEGASIGASSSSKTTKSLIGDFYGIRGRLLFMKKYFPQHIAIVYVGLLITIIRRILRGQYRRVVMVLKLIHNPKMLYDDFLNDSK